MLDKIEDFMNRLTDMDWGWWPVLSLRPAKDKDFDNITLLKISLVFGSLVGVLLLMVGVVATKSLTVSGFISAIVLGWMLFFVVYKITFVYFWNRRARHLRGV